MLTRAFLLLSMGYDQRPSDVRPHDSLTTLTLRIETSVEFFERN